MAGGEALCAGGERGLLTGENWPCDGVCERLLKMSVTLFLRHLLIVESRLT